MNLLKDEMFLEFLEFGLKKDNCIEAKTIDNGICLSVSTSAISGFEEEMSFSEVSSLCEQFLFEEYKTWINSKISYYDIKKGNKLTLTTDSNSRRKVIKIIHEVVIGFDEMSSIADIKNKAIIDYVFKIYKLKNMQ